MRIAISGCSGFIGGNLKRFLEYKGFAIVPLSHHMFDDDNTHELMERLKGCDVIINLAGTSINQRWTKKVREEIMQSRVNVTRKLVDCVSQMSRRPDLFISTSAVGIYASEGVSTEDTKVFGKGYLTDVCINWEKEANRIPSDVRLVITRFGVVLSNEGGALPKMVLPFRFMMGGKIASGKQGFSWIHINDLMEAMLYIIQHPEISGVVNMTSPGYVDNAELTKAISHVIRRPALFTIPSFVFKLIYKSGSEVFLGGQKAYPQRLLDADYQFRFPDIKGALSDILLHH